MHQNNTQFLFCFASVVFLIFNILISSSLSAVVLVDEQYASCAPLGNSTCSPSLEIKYPFWDSSRPGYCGHPGFGLKCQANSLTIKIENQTYNVLDINYKSNVFTISKPQFSQVPCPATESELKNSTLDLTLFTFTSKTQNAGLFYDCEQEADSTAIFSFSCPQNTNSYGPQTTTSSFSSSFSYLAVDEKWEDVLRPLCSININIPVFKTAVTDLQNGRSTMNNVVSGGFELKWVIDESQCKDCSGTGGRCGYNQTLYQPICFCQNGASTTTCAQLDDLQGTALTSPDQKRQSKKTIVIGVGVAAVASSLVLLSILGVIYQRRYRKKKSSLRSVPRDNWPGAFSTTLDANASTYFGVQVLSYTMLEEATDYFNPAKEIGAGGFGTVYYGKLQDGREVAIKRLYENNNKRAAQFLNEVEILANLRHKNLVNLYGCTSRQSRELLLVYEYVANGTVADHLHGKNAKLGLLQWSRRLSIATETACALLYLHDSDIIHRDVKTQNVLLDKDFSVKVADFGLSRLFPLDVTHVSTAPQGTPGYVDPEYHQCYQLTEKSDVYSFGVLLAELLSSKPAVDITRHRADINLANMLISKIQIDALDEFVDPSLEFQSDFELKKEITAVAELAYQCLQSTREMRPSMEQVLERLYNIQDHEDKIDRAEVVDVPSDDVFMLKGDDYSPASSSMDDNSVRRLIPHASV